MYTDPIADLLTRIRNAGAARHATVAIPSSREKVEIVRVLKEEGYVTDYSVSEHPVQPELTVVLKYQNGRHVITGIQRESRPGQRRYVNSRAVPRVLGGLGVAILTTSRGVMTGKNAVIEKVGGEYICSVW